MSADRQRLTSAIRRIAKTDPEIRGIPDAADNKGGKPGAAGVGSSTDAESQRICCDGSVSDNANPGTETREPVDGDQDGLDPNDPADLSGLDGGCLTGVTNCDTGEAVCFCGDGFIPPDGWDDPSQPPILDGWFDGYYWSRSGVDDLTCCEVYRRVIEGDGFAFCGCSVDDSGSTVTYTRSGNIGGTCDGSTFTATDACFKRDCSASYIASLCDLDEPPREEAWPSDSCVNLAVKGGTIVGSKYDPENDGSYSAPRSEIHLCDGTDDMYLKPSADGGWKSIDSTREAGYLYNSSFEQIAHIDGSEHSDPTI